MNRADGRHELRPYVRSSGRHERKHHVTFLNVYIDNVVFWIVVKHVSNHNKLLSGTGHDIVENKYIRDDTTQTHSRKYWKYPLRGLESLHLRAAIRQMAPH